MLESRIIRMSIIKNKFGDYTINCDSCLDFYDTTESDVDEAWKEAKAAGWVRKYDPESYVYVHYCPECWEKMK